MDGAPARRAALRSGLRLLDEGPRPPGPRGRAARRRRGLPQDRGAQEGAHLRGAPRSTSTGGCSTARSPPGSGRRAEADLQTTFARPWTTPLPRLPRRTRTSPTGTSSATAARRSGQVEAVVRGGRRAPPSASGPRAPLQRHDGLQMEIPGLDRPFGFGVAGLRVVTRGGAAEAFEAPAGALVEVPLPDDYPTIPIGAPVACSSSQLVKLQVPGGEPEPRHPARPAPHARHRRGLRRGASGSVAATEVSPGRTVRAEVAVAGAFEPARDAAKMAASARAAFEKLGDTRFQLEALDWRDPAGRFVPVSRLNEARRALCEALDAAVTADAQGAGRGRARRARRGARAAPVDGPERLHRQGGPPRDARRLRARGLRGGRRRRGGPRPPAAARAHRAAGGARRAGRPGAAAARAPAHRARLGGEGAAGPGRGAARGRLPALGADRRRLLGAPRPRPGRPWSAPRWRPAASTSPPTGASTR